MKTTIGLKDGGYAVTVTAKKINETAMNRLIDDGVKYNVQRSSIDAVLGIIKEQDGRMVRTGMSRSDCKYSPKVAEKLKNLFASTLAEFGDFDIEVTESIGDSKPYKYSRERSLVMAKVAAGKPLAAIAETVGYTGEASIDNEEFLAAVKRFLDSAL
jgi:hypothetical protein